MNISQITNKNHLKNYIMLNTDSLLHSLKVFSSKVFPKPAEKANVFRVIIKKFLKLCLCRHFFEQQLKG